MVAHGDFVKTAMSRCSRLFVLIVALGMATRPALPMPSPVNDCVSRPTSSVNLGDLIATRAVTENASNDVAGQKPVTLHIDNYIGFASAPKKVKLLDGKYPCKPWTNSEVQEIREIGDRVYRFGPGLFKLAATTGKISLWRVAKVPLNSPVLLSSYADAITENDNIYISDAFFAGNYRFREFVHELVHAADFGYHLTYSKEWVSFAQPIISKLKLRQEMTPHSRYYDLEQLIRTQNIWPSLSGCQNLKEALAEYFAAFAENSKFCTQESFRNGIAQRLICPVEADLLWSKRCRLGAFAFDKQDYAKALAEFSKAVALDPLAPLPHIFIARIHFHQFDDQKCLDESDVASECFKKAGVLPTDPTYHTLKLLRSSVLERLGRHEDAKKELEDCQVEFPIKSPPKCR